MVCKICATKLTAI